jgi:hypothetical protein
VIPPSVRESANAPFFRGSLGEPLAALLDRSLGPSESWQLTIRK